MIRQWWSGAQCTNATKDYIFIDSMKMDGNEKFGVADEEFE